ncbi:MAG: inositol monophosphatase [Deltaproteobacteria bacterium]|nr:inositol monophosphatase [Deltaproteobacteria bacterium]
MNLNHELSIARKAALAAGEIQKRMFLDKPSITRKGETEILTEADLASERVILDVIGRHFPGDGIITEESGEHNPGRERVWLVDPLDGTTNFARGFPFFGVSIALEIGGDPVLGVIFNPSLDEYFEALKDSGAFRNKKRIRVSKVGALDASLLATGFSYDVQNNPERPVELFKKMLVRSHSVRRPGSAAIDLCYVACGIFDGFWEEGLKPWDTAAGIVMVREARGKLTTFDATPYTPYEKSIVASNGLVHDTILQVLNSP